MTDMLDAAAYAVFQEGYKADTVQTAIILS